MHEWALAEAVVVAAADAAHENGMSAVEEVVVRLGELQEIDREAFSFGLSAIQVQTPAMETTVFVFETDPAELRCRRCARLWPLAESRAAMSEDDQEAIHLLPETVHVYATCPACASPDFEVVRGRGVTVGTIRGS